MTLVRDAAGVLTPSPIGQPERAPRLERNRDARAAQHRRRTVALVVVVVGIVIVAAGVVHAWGMWDAPSRIDDEGTYVSEAWAVQTGYGLAHYTYWYDHPPLGWMQIAAWTGLTGAFERAPNAIAAGREVMLLAKVASCLLLYILARRMGLRRASGVGAVALFAFSPLAIEFQRRVFLDNVATPWLLAAFVLALSPQRRVSAAGWAALCFAVAVLSKETVLVLFPAFVLALWQHADARNRKFTVTMSLVVTGLIVSVYPLFAILQGEMIPGPGHVSLWDAATWQVFERAGSGSMFDAGSDVRGLVDHWADFDPWLLGTAAVCVPIGLWARRLRPIALVVAIQALVLLRGGYVPYMYVIAVLPFAALLVAGVANEAWELRSRLEVRRRSPDITSSWQRRVARHMWVPARLALVGALAVSAVFVAPAWAERVQDQMTVERDAPMKSAQAWVEGHVPKDAIVVVDDAIWLDLVRDGRRPKDVIWFYKLDLDPAVELADGWRSIDYLVLTAFNADFVPGLTDLATAVRNSDVVGSFGEGPDQVSIYEVRK